MKLGWLLRTWLPILAFVVCADTAAAAAVDAPPATTGAAMPVPDCPAIIDRYFVVAVPLLLDRAADPDARLAALASADPCRDARLVTVWMPLAEDSVLGPAVAGRLAVSDDPRATSRLRALLRSPRSQSRILSALTADATTASVELLARWATDSTLPRSLRSDLRDILVDADPARAESLPVLGRPARFIGPAWGGALVGGTALGMLGYLGQDPDLGALIGTPLGALAGGGLGAVLSIRREVSPAAALRLASYPSWGLLLGSGWAWAVDSGSGDSLTEGRLNAALLMAGTGAGMGAAILDQADLPVARQLRVDYGMLGGMTAAMGVAALVPDNPVSRWSMISAGTIGGGLLAALHGRDGGADTGDRLALATWPVLASGTARFTHLALRGSRPDRGTQVWPWAMLLPAAEDAPWAGIGWGTGSLAALVAVGLPAGAPGDYAAREVAVVASAGLLGGSLLPLAANAAAWQHRERRTVDLTGLGLHLGTAVGLTVAGAFDLPSARAGYGIGGAAWTLLAANGIDTLWGDVAERVHASRVNTAAIAVGYAAGAWLLPLVDWRPNDVAAGSVGLAWGAWQGGVAAAHATRSRRQRWSGTLLGAAAGSAGGIALSHSLDADGMAIAGLGASGLAGAALGTSLWGIADLDTDGRRLSVLLVPDALLLVAGLALASPAVDGRALTFAGTGALLGAGFGALGGVMITADRLGLGIGSAVGWTAGAVGGVLVERALDRRDERKAAARKVAAANQRLPLALRGLAPLSMHERGSGEPIPGLAVELAILPPPLVGPQPRSTRPSGTL
jgi:hypothetical protein